MNKEEFIKQLEELKINVTDKQLEIYKNYLKEYNEHTNLTSIKDDNDIYLKHFYDSLTIVKATSLEGNLKLLDVGSGAGFPGVVIKIFFPNIDVTLIDANNKKTTFLSKLKTELNINYNVINGRVEDFAKNNLNTFDIVTSRAVANLRILSELCFPLVKDDGIFVALKGNMDETLEGALDTIEIMHGKINKVLNFTLYKNEGIRNIIVIEKKEKTNLTELRNFVTIQT